MVYTLFNCSLLVNGTVSFQANVVCRQLGFSRASEATINSHFGSVPDEFAFDDVFCSGNEAALTECAYVSDDNCNSIEGAGVICVP